MIAVILCGGVGSRLWPVSREKYPKPFIPVLDDETFIGKTIARVCSIPGLRKIYTVTNTGLFFKVADTIREQKPLVDTAHILEPFGRNTAPAIAAAAMAAEEAYDDDATLLVLPADHLITDTKAFIQTISDAKHLADDNNLVLFGIKPTEPRTDYGYIQANGNTVLRFHEKPNEEKARQFLEEDNFFWNSGMLLFKVSTILHELRHHAPEVFATMQDCFLKSSFVVNKSIDNLQCMELDPNSFARSPDISIDYAVIEKSMNCAVVPCNIGWSDIGSWSALADLSSADENKNRVLKGDEVLLQNSTNNDLYVDKRLVVGIGLNDLLIVDTPDALLVADKSRANEVKEVVTELKKKKHPSAILHSTVYTPWGAYTNLETGPRFKIKRLTLRPGAAISMQLHHHRNEHWIVVSGMAEVTCDDQTFYLDSNESTFIKAGHKHMVANKGIIDLVIMEVQTGDYLGEDDIVRYTDKYGRSEKQIFPSSE